MDLAVPGFVHETGGVEGLAAIVGMFSNYTDLNWELPDTGNHIQVFKKKRLVRSHALQTSFGSDVAQ